MVETGGIAADALRSFIERVERLEEENRRKRMEKRAEENAQVASVVHRLRSPSLSLVPSEIGEHSDLNASELGIIEFKKIFDEVQKLKDIEDASGDKAESIRSSMFGSVKDFDFGAPFPQLPSRAGVCEYSPLFWAIEAAAAEGHKEAFELVELLLKAGAQVHRPITQNNHSWVEGSLVAMAVSAAVEAAAPLPPDDEERTFERLSVGEVLLRLNHAMDKDEPDLPETNKHLTVSSKHEGEDETPSLNDSDDDPTFHHKVIAHAGNVEDVQRQSALHSLRAPRAQNTTFSVEEAQGELIQAIPEKLKMHQGVLRPQGSRFGPAHLAARRDIPGLMRTVVIGQTTMEARALEIARDENNRRAAAIRNAVVNTNNGAGSVYSDESDHNIYETMSDDESAEAAFEKQLLETNTKELEMAIAEATDKSTKITALAQGVMPIQMTSKIIKPLTRDDDSNRGKTRSASSLQADDDQPSDVEITSDQLTEIQTKMYDEIDKIGAPSEFGEDSVQDEFTQKTPQYLPEPAPKMTREALELRQASRAKTTMAVAIELLMRCDRHNVDAFARNPLLALYGVGLVPYEYTPLFAALYGAATAKSQEQLSCGISLAKLCLNQGANVEKCGFHSMLAPQARADMLRQLKTHRMTRYRELRERYVEKGDNNALHESLDDGFRPEAEKSLNMRSYPLMWAVTAALRAESRKLGCEGIVRHMLMEGADPTSISLQSVGTLDGANSRLKNGSVLYLWGATDQDLFKVSQHRYQTVISVRLNIARMLSECGARSTYRAKPSMDYITSRALEDAHTVGRWQIKGQSGFGIVAATKETHDDDEVDINRVKGMEPFQYRVARALHAEGERKRHVTIESRREREVNAITTEQGADVKVGTWMWPTKEESASKYTASDAGGDNIIGYRSTERAQHIHKKHPGQIELLAEDTKRLEGDRMFKPAANMNYNKHTAIYMAESDKRKTDNIVSQELRKAQISAVKAAFRGEESDIDARLIDDALLPDEMIK